MVTTVEATDVQSALDAAEPNEEIAVEGRATTEEPVVVDTPGVTLRGLELDLADAADENVVVVVADGVRLVDFRLDGNRDNQPGDRQSSGVVVAGASNVTVADGEVQRVSRHGVLVTERTNGDVVDEEVGLGAAPASDVTVRDVRVASPRRDGCSIDGGHTTAGVRNVRVENVRTFDSTDRGSVEVKDGTVDAVVTGCYAEDCRYGVAIQDHGDRGVDNVVVANNQAVACDTVVDAQTSVRHEAVTVAGNAGRDVSGEGMGGPGGIYMGRVDGLVVANNRVDGSENGGIVVEDCTDAAVSDNVLRDVSGSPGIDIVDAPGALISGNVVRGGTDGIRCRAVEVDTADLQVANNRCVDAAGYGVRLVDDGSALDHVLVSENVVRNNSEGGIDFETAGSNLIASDNLS